MLFLEFGDVSLEGIIETLQFLGAEEAVPEGVVSLLLVPGCDRTDFLELLGEQFYAFLESEGVVAKLVVVLGEGGELLRVLAV